MDLFKSILSTVLIYVTVAGLILTGIYSIKDVNVYADEAIAVEQQCRDGNYDAANCYQVTKAADGSYYVDYAARDLDDLIVRAYYDANGNYRYTEKNISKYVTTDILGILFIGVFIAGFDYVIYLILVELVAWIVDLINKRKTKKLETADEAKEEDSSSNVASMQRE